MAVSSRDELRYRTPLIFLLLCVCMIASAAEGQVRDRIATALDTNQVVPLPGSTSPLALAQYDVGRADPDTPLNGIMLCFAPSPAQQSQLDQLLQTQQNPSSAQYRAWLTPAEYGNRFGLSDSDISKIEGWLQSQGFSVGSVSNAHTSIRFSGTIAQVEKTLQTEMHHYEIDGEPHTANATTLSIPAALSGVITGVRNLTDFRLRPAHLSRKVRPDFDSGIAGAHYLAPDDFTTIYDVKALYDEGYTGSGETIAVIGTSAIAVSDIANFRSASGLPANPPTFTLVPGSGVSTITNRSDEGEADLDIEWSGAVAPAATINFVYVGNNPNYGVFDALQYAIDNDLGQVISLSGGSCELGFPPTEVTAQESWFQEANAQGQTVVAASGDSGAAACDYYDNPATQGLALLYPASSPYVTGVGGTEFYGDVSSPDTYWNQANNSSNGSAISYIPEEAWNDPSTSSVLLASGGGKSILFAKPDWQTGIGVPADGARDVPDVSLSASTIHDPYLTCSSAVTPDSCSNGFWGSQGELTPGGGTSFSTPSFAGIVALIDQKFGSHGLGNINPMIYQAAASDYSTAFHDITIGNNQVPCKAGSKDCGSSGTIGYSATTGYDLATGWGSVDAYNLAAAFSRNAPKQPMLTIFPAQVTIAALGASGTSTVTVYTSAGYAGTVTFTASLPSGLNGTCTFSPTSVTLTSGGSGTTTLTINTQTASASLRRVRASNLKVSFAFLGLTTALAFVWVPIGSQRRRRTLLLLSCVGVVIAGIGCGGSGSRSSNSSPKNYAITVTATDTTNSNMTASTTLTLTVQ